MRWRLAFQVSRLMTCEEPARSCAACWRRAGADPTALRPRFGPNDRALPWHEAGPCTCTQRRNQVARGGLGPVRSVLRTSGLGLVLTTRWPTASFHPCHPGWRTTAPFALAACQPFENDDRFIDLLSLCA